MRRPGETGHCRSGGHAEAAQNSFKIQRFAFQTQPKIKPPLGRRSAFPVIPLKSSSFLSPSHPRGETSQCPDLKGRPSWSRTTQSRTPGPSPSPTRPAPQTSVSLSSPTGRERPGTNGPRRPRRDPCSQSPCRGTRGEEVGGHSAAAADPGPGPGPGEPRPGRSGLARWPGAPGSEGCGNSGPRPRRSGRPRGF